MVSFPAAVPVFIEYPVKEQRRGGRGGQARERGKERKGKANKIFPPRSFHRRSDDSDSSSHAVPDSFFLPSCWVSARSASLVTQVYIA